MNGLENAAALRAYIAGVKDTGDDMAARIDAGADAVLDSIVKAATSDTEHLLNYYKTTGQRLSDAPEKIKEMEARIAEIKCLVATDRGVC